MSVILAIIDRFVAWADRVFGVRRTTAGAPRMSRPITPPEPQGAAREAEYDLGMRQEERGGCGKRCGACRITRRGPLKFEAIMATIVAELGPAPAPVFASMSGGSGYTSIKQRIGLRLPSVRKSISTCWPDTLRLLQLPRQLANPDLGPAGYVDRLKPLGAERF